MAVSPYSRNNQSTSSSRFGGWWFNPRWQVDHGRYAHESILSFISYRFGLGYLNKRHKYANNIGHSFNFRGRIDSTPPSYPIRPPSSPSPARSAGATWRTPSRRTRMTWRTSRTSPSA